MPSSHDLQAVIFDWGGTLTRWHDVDFHAESHALAQAVVDAEHHSAAEITTRLHAAGDVVTLTGHVGTWLQRDIAERAAAGAPGIRRVDNLITVEPPIEKEEDHASAARRRARSGSITSGSSRSITGVGS